MITIYCLIEEFFKDVMGKKEHALSERGYPLRV